MFSSFQIVSEEGTGIMFTSSQAKELLEGVEWQEGKIVPVVEGPYRYRVVAHCSSRGRQKAVFSDSQEHPYFCYIELLSGNGQWIEYGNGIVPVLPGGRLLMVVEQRPAQSRYTDRLKFVEIGGQKINLADFGPHSSLEFPGGAVDPQEGLKMGALRELQEETGIGSQYATLYSCCRPVYLFGSDIAIKHISNVVYLQGFSYKEHTETDGGLNVLVLSSDEVRRNIWSGAISSGQACLATWRFYEEVEKSLADTSFGQEMISRGYMKKMTVNIQK